MNSGIRIAAISLVAIASLSACADTTSSNELTDGMIPMNRANVASVEKITASSFCGPVKDAYAKYGEVVVKRAEIRSKSGQGGINKKDTIQNIVDQQNVVQALEDHTAKYSVTNNTQLESERTIFRKYSEALVDAFNASKESGETTTIDPAISQWQAAAQPMVLTCQSLKSY